MSLTKDLDTILMLDKPEGNYSIACIAALGYLRTYHDTILRNHWAAKRMAAMDMAMKNFDPPSEVCACGGGCEPKNPTRGD